MSYIEPALPLLLLLGFIVLIDEWRQPRRGIRPYLFTVSIGGIFLLSTNLFAWLFALPLEIWYDDRDPAPSSSAEAIVILSGAVNPPLPNQPYPYVGADTYRSLQRGVWLYTQWQPLPILVCGGKGNDDEPYAKTMKHVLESEGVQSNFIWVEDRSRSTHENAVYGTAILRAHGVSRIALIAQTNSMPRAAASFKKLGITVLPVPIRSTRLDWNISDVFPN